MAMQMLCDWCGQIVPEDEQEEISVGQPFGEFANQRYDCHAVCVTNALQEIALTMNGDHPKGE